MPGSVLDQIKSKEESGEYRKDTRYGQKRKFEKPVSRKEKRKEERKAKKLKSHPKPHENHREQPTQKKEQHFQKREQPNKKEREVAAKTHVQKSHSRDETDPLAALAALKKGKKTSEIRIVKEDELDEPLDDSEDSGTEGLENENSELEGSDFEGLQDSEPELRVVKVDDLDDSDEMGSENFGSEDFGSGSEFGEEDDEEDDEEEDPMEALRKLKEAKRAKTEQKPESEVELPSEDEEEEFSEDEEDEFSLEEEEDPLAKLKALKDAKKKKQEEPIEATFVDPVEADLEYYAKKLGLKDGKRSKLTKLDEDDVVGGLLDGLDLDFSSDAGSAYEEQLSESEPEDVPRAKENPFVAPSTNAVSEDGSSQPTKYIPPALRRKLANETAGLSPEIVALQKAIKGPINKLSETNVGSIVNEINGLFLNHPRQTVNENLTSIILDSIIQQGRLLDAFVYLHSVLVVAIYRTQGVDFGAYFVQTCIEKFEQYRVEPSKSKEALNTISLISSVYAFQLVSSKILYDLIRVLIDDLTEFNSELLLKIIRNSGNQMRADDPSSLKEIVLQVTQKSSSLATNKVSPRMQFLIETITSLKNNKLRVENESSHDLVVRLKKFLGTFTSGKVADPLQVSLDDIKNIETKGKWWLVGSAWKGNDSMSKEPLSNIAAMNDILDNAEPNWLELAKAQRMNTDIRRAIFISIMSANDFIDAMTKLDKLALKKANEREIPRIVVHCAVVEPAWNPYYGILAAKLCDSHSYRKTFQFLLWDLLKGFDGTQDEDDDDFGGFDDDVDDEDKLKKILNLGRLFGHLFAEGSLALHILRTVNFLAASPDVRMFMEVLLVTFLDQVAKKSQVNAIGAGLVGKNMSEQKFDDRTLIERILKAKDEPTLLRGMSYFVQKRLVKSDFVTGRKQKKRVDWGVKSMCDIIDEIARETNY